MTIGIIALQRRLLPLMILLSTNPAVLSFTPPPHDNRRCVTFFHHRTENIIEQPRSPRAAAAAVQPLAARTLSRAQSPKWRLHSNLFQSGKSSNGKAEEPTDASSDFPSKFQQAVQAAEVAELKELEADALRQRKQTALLNGGLGISMMLFGGGVKTVVAQHWWLRILSGLTLLYASALIFQNKSGMKGYKLSSAAGAVVAWFMGRRHFQLGEAYVPTGVLATVAIVTLCYNGIDALVALSEQRGWPGSSKATKFK